MMGKMVEGHGRELVAKSEQQGWMGTGVGFDRLAHSI